MTFVDNLSRGSLEDIFRRIRKLEAGSPMNNSAIGSGGIEVYEGGTINISSGNIVGAGGFSWTGSFFQSGTTTFSGSMTIAGPTGITGTLDIQGATSVAGDFDLIAGGLFKAGESVIRPDGSAKFGGLDIAADGKLTSGLFELKPDGSAKFGLFEVAANGNLVSKGTLSIEGVTTLKNDLNVTAGGKVKVGALTIEPIAGGQLNFTGGAISRSATFGMLANDAIAVELAAPTVKLTSSSTVVSGQLTVNNKPLAPSGATPNVYWDPATGVFKLIP